MKKLWLVLVVIAFGCNKPNSDVAKTVSNLQTVKSEEKPEPEGPLSFWSGDLIVGEGPHRKEIELVGREGKSSVVLVQDNVLDGTFSLSQVKSDGCILTYERGEAPAIHVKKTLLRFSPLYGLSDSVKRGKITPLIAPDIISPVERIYRKKGQKLEGYVWCVYSYGQQVYGHATDRDEAIRDPKNSRVRLAPMPKVSFERIEVDLLTYGLTVKEMEEKGPEKGQKNGTVEYNTPVGKFLKVYSFGNYSINPKGFHNGGMRYDTIRLPSGKWIRGFPGPVSLQEMITIDGKTFLVTETQVFEWLGNDKAAVVASIDYPARICSLKKPIAEKYLEIHKSDTSNFGGLLEYSKEQWKFHYYDGDYGNWADKCETSDNDIVISLFSWSEGPFKEVKKIRFDRLSGKFTDL